MGNSQKTLPPGNTKYPAVWMDFPPLANWMDRLPEVTTLATLKSAIDETMEDWMILSAAPWSRSEGDFSQALCISEMDVCNDHFPHLVRFLETNYGAHCGSSPKMIDTLIMRLGGMVRKLTLTLGPEATLKQVQQLDGSVRRSIVPADGA